MLREYVKTTLYNGHIVTFDYLYLLTLSALCLIQRTEVSACRDLKIVLARAVSRSLVF